MNRKRWILTAMPKFLSESASFLTTTLFVASLELPHSREPLGKAIFTDTPAFFE
jgi:hypothetical protein